MPLLILDFACIALLTFDALQMHVLYTMSLKSNVTLQVQDKTSNK